MKRYLPFVIVAGVGLATVGTGAMLYRAKRSAVLSVPKHSVEDPALGARHAHGEADAPVTLVEFGDFECPPCGRLAASSESIQEGFGKQLRIVFRHFPLPTHKHALEAAQASEAADLQGHFWEMHEQLYKEQAVWSKSGDARALFEGYAATLGLDVDRFKADMDSPEVRERIEADRKRGADLGVTATPTIFVNNQQVPMPIDLAGVRGAIDAALKPKPSP